MGVAPAAKRASHESFRADHREWQITGQAFSVTGVATAAPKEVGAVPGHKAERMKAASMVEEKERPVARKVLVARLAAALFPRTIWLKESLLRRKASRVRFEGECKKCRQWRQTAANSWNSEKAARSPEPPPRKDKDDDKKVGACYAKEEGEKPDDWVLAVRGRRKRGRSHFPFWNDIHRQRQR